MYTNIQDDPEAGSCRAQSCGSYYPKGISWGKGNGGGVIWGREAGQVTFARVMGFIIVSAERVMSFIIVSAEILNPNRLTCGEVGNHVLDGLRTGTYSRAAV